jgi:hypothetical protein
MRKIVVEEERRNLRAVEQVLDVVVRFGQRLVLGVQLVIDGIELLVHRLELLLRALQLFVGGMMCPTRVSVRHANRR